MHKRVPIFVTLAVSVVACLPAQGQNGRPAQTGAVFVMTNAADQNQVIAFARGADGSLSDPHAFSTGGRGTGGSTDPLQSQGSLVVSNDNSLLFAANPGSGEITEFQVHGAQLERTQVIPSGGSSPIAIAQRGNQLYVLNVGGNDSIATFRLGSNGRLQQVHSVQQLSNNDSGAAGLAISPDGQFLAVTERLNAVIDTFRISGDGSLGPIVSTTSSGPAPFSIGFTPSGALLTTEAAQAAVSSYAVQADGKLSTISGSLPTGGKAACWHAVTPDGHFVYTSNAGTSSISGFAIANNGSLTPIGGAVVAIQSPESTNLDIAITADGRFLYSLNSGTGTVGVFGIQSDGTLLSQGTAGDIPAGAGANGIAAF